MKSSANLGARSEACPCCGMQHAPSRKTACGVCDWQNDGYDNAQAFQYSEKNGTNLNLARYRFLRGGAKASRTVRTFRIDDSGGFVEELCANGTVIYRGPIPFVDYAVHGEGIAAIPLRRRSRK